MIDEMVEITNGNLSNQFGVAQNEQWPTKLKDAEVSEEYKANIYFKCLRINEDFPKSESGCQKN